MTDSDSGRTGVFFRKSRSDYIVLWRGREICRYENLEAFMTTHLAGLQALEKNQADLLERYYKTLR